MRYLVVSIVLVLALVASATVRSAAERVAAAETSDRAGGSLGTVRIPHRVQADGKALAPGAYEVRLTDADASPTPAGETAGLERWVEFVQHGVVKGREVATIVPASEIKQVADAGTTLPRTGAAQNRGAQRERVPANLAAPERSALSDSSADRVVTFSDPNTEDG
jgi:hypothetical protein